METFPWPPAVHLSDADRAFIETMYRLWRTLEADRLVFSDPHHATALKALSDSILRLTAAVAQISAASDTSDP